MREKNIITAWQDHNLVVLLQKGEQRTEKQQDFGRNPV